MYNTVAEKSFLAASENVSEDVLMQTIDEVLSILGESIKTSIYYHLENTMGLKKHEIPARLADFHFALEKMFGKLGTKYIEDQLIKQLEKKRF